MKAIMYIRIIAFNFPSTTEVLTYPSDLEES